MVFPLCCWWFSEYGQKITALFIIMWFLTASKQEVIFKVLINENKYKEQGYILKTDENFLLAKSLSRYLLLSERDAWCWAGLKTCLVACISFNVVNLRAKASVLVLLCLHFKDVSHNNQVFLAAFLLLSGWPGLFETKQSQRFVFSVFICCCDFVSMTRSQKEPQGEHLLCLAMRKCSYSKYSINTATQSSMPYPHF